jgi:hypothetical protein
VLETAVHLVDEEARAAFLAEGDDAVQLLRLWQVAGRVVRGVDHEHARPGLEQRVEVAEVHAPAAAVLDEGPGHDLGASPRGDVGQRLVTRGLDDDAVAGLDGGEGREEDALLGDHDQDVLGGDIAQRRDALAQRRIALRLGVAEAQVQELACGHAGELQELLDRERLAIGGREEVGGAEFPARKGPFESELGDHVGADSTLRVC